MQNYIFIDALMTIFWGQMLFHENIDLDNVWLYFGNTDLPDRRSDKKS